MPEISQEDLDQVHKDVKLLREAAESKNAESSENREKMEKITASLDAAEIKNEKLSNEIALANKNITELGDLKEALASGEAKALETVEETRKQIRDLEADIAKKNFGASGKDPDEWRNSDEYKAFEILVREGEKSNNFTPEVKALLRTDSNVAGGYLTRVEMDNIMIKFMTEVSNVRAICSVRQTTEKSMETPVRKTIGEAFYEGEAESNEEANTTYGSETMHTYRLSARTPATMDQLMNASFNMDTEIMVDTAEMFAQKEGNRFVLGTGQKQPEGFLIHPDLITAAFSSGASAAISSDAILEIQGELKVGHNPRFVFSRQTLATLRTTKGSTNDHYLWDPALNGGVSNQLAGAPYTILQDMPGIAANSFSLAYGDFVRGYRVLDRTGMIMVRDDVTQANNAIVKFVFHKWNNGQVINIEAIKLMKCDA